VRAKKNFAIFSRIIEWYEITFYTVVTHALRCKSGEFNYIIYRTNKITLLLVIAPSSCDVIKNILNYSRQFKHRKCDHFL